jgi:hypothetical protein
MNRGRFDTSDDEQLPRLAFLGRGSLSFHYTDRFTRSSSFGRALSAGRERSRFRGGRAAFARQTRRFQARKL